MARFLKNPLTFSVILVHVGESLPGPRFFYHKLIENPWADLKSPFPGFKTLKEIWECCDVVAGNMPRVVSAIMRDVRELGKMAIERNWVRVPLDIARHGVRSLPWRPHDRGRTRTKVNTAGVGRNALKKVSTE